jgi:hypothetical protein
VISEHDYIRHSLELNLFFLRIVKEHTIFAAASLPPRDLPLSQQAIAMKSTFEGLLSRAIRLSNGIVSPEVLSSGELVTELTIQAEKATQFLTGIPIDTDITKRELALNSSLDAMERSDSLKASQSFNVNTLLPEVNTLNQTAILATTAAIKFKTTLLNNVLNCRSFSYMYPSMLEHVIEEAQFYVKVLNLLQRRDVIDDINEIIELEITWNDIMGEHSEFIRGYLDPSEKQLIKTANTFAEEFDKLLEATENLRNQPNLLPQVTTESLQLVTELRNFKRQGEEGILACRIKSIIPPLLSDHVLREANHYIRVLKNFTK